MQETSLPGDPAAESGLLKRVEHLQEDNNEGMRQELQARRPGRGIKGLDHCLTMLVLARAELFELFTTAGNLQPLRGNLEP